MHGYMIFPGSDFDGAPRGRGFGPRRGGFGPGGPRRGFDRGEWGPGGGDPREGRGPHGEGHGPHGHGHGRGRGFDPRLEGFGPGFGPGLARGRGRGGRRHRGDVRSALLLLLSEQPRHGYELMTEIVERSGGVWRPSPGSVYPALSQLEDEGLIAFDQVEGRKTAKLTEAGERYVAEHKADLGSPWDAVRDSVADFEIDFRRLVGAIAIATRQVAEVGTADQRRQAQDLLTEARKGLYRILAGDDAPGDDAPGGTAPEADAAE